MQKNKIKEIRKALGLSQPEFGELIGIKAPQVSLIESGKHDLSEKTKLRIIEKYHVNPVWLDTGEGEMFLPFSKSDEIIRFARSVTKAEDGDIRLEIMKILARMTPEQWEESWNLWCRAKLLINDIKKDGAK